MKLNFLLYLKKSELTPGTKIKISMIRIGMYLIILTAIFSACKGSSGPGSLTDDSGNIDLGNNTVFRILDKETVLNTNDVNLSEFDSLKPNEAYSLSLYASIEHPDYRFFIGVPSDDDFERIKARPLPSNARMMQKTAVGQSFEYRFYQLDRDSSYVGELLYRIPTQQQQLKEDQLYLIIGQSKSKKQGVRQLSRESMVSRFVRS